MTSYKDYDFSRSDTFYGSLGEGDSLPDREAFDSILWGILIMWFVVTGAIWFHEKSLVQVLQGQALFIPRILGKVWEVIITLKIM